MKFREAIDLLRDTGNQPVVLQGRSPGHQVLCAPSLVGRVMSATFDRMQGAALGWIGEEAIRKGPVDPVFNNFGGEERFWFGPEGSQFGLHFSNKDQKLSSYRVQPGMNSQPYEVVRVSAPNDSLVMKARMEFENLCGTRFDVEVERLIRVMYFCPYTCGHSSRVEFAGFQSESLVTNMSRQPIRADTGLLCSWTPGQHPNGARSLVVLPFRSDNDTELGEPIRRDYFQQLCVGGDLPANRWRVTGDHVLMKTDGQCRVKVGIGKRRATNRLGSMDPDAAHVVIQDFDLYSEMDYVAPYWRELTAGEILDGEAVSAYIDGPDENNNRAGDFYELETLSPAMPLAPGESFLHRNRVFHLRGDRTVLDRICKKFLKAGFEEGEAFLQGLEQ